MPDMRSPSSRVLTNRVDIYSGTQSQDADGGVQYTYPAVPTMAAVACSAQPVEAAEVLVQDRLMRETRWEVMFGSSAMVMNRDKLIITAPDGTPHEAFVDIQQDQAGRGSAYVVYAIERR